MVRYLVQKKHVFYLLLLSMILLGCSKANTLMRILGTWDVVNVTDVTAPVKERWRFDVDDILIITHFMTVNNKDSVLSQVSGSYQVKVKLVKKYIDIYSFTGGYDFLNARWQIIKSDGKILMIIKDTHEAVMIKEFTKL
jgi:hypothetical protein